MLHAHADVNDGEIIYGWNGKDYVADAADVVSAYVTSVSPFQYLSQLLRKYLGVPLLNEIISTQGIAGVILMTCGPCWTVPAHFSRITEIISEYVISIPLNP